MSISVKSTLKKFEKWLGQLKSWIASRFSGQVSLLTSRIWVLCKTAGMIGLHIVVTYPGVGDVLKGV